MSQIVVFTTTSCLYCVKAKKLLNDHSIPFVEVNLHDRPSLWKEMQERTKGKSSVPQIFFHKEHIGVC